MSLHKIVGAHFRPPAKSILAVLHAGCPLTIIPEPENPYDSNAMAVHIDPKAIKTTQAETLDELAQTQGFSLQDILDQSDWHLGYIPAVEAKDLIAAFNAAPAYDATVAFNATGATCVKLTLLDAEPETSEEDSSNGEA